MSIVIKEQEPLSRHTVFRLGGPARFFVEAGSAGEICQAIGLAADKALPWLILGAGSNVLVADRGFPGVVIHPTGGAIRISGNRVFAEAGLAMAAVVAASLRAGLLGFEWAVGVPGTIGGSVVGNAGCFGGETSQVLWSISVYDAAHDRIEEWPASQAGLGYRESVFKKTPGLVVLAATFLLHKGDPAEGRQKLLKLVQARTERFLAAAGREFFNPAGRVGSQEVGVPTAGSTFKNVLWSRQDVDRDGLLRRFPEFRAFAANPGLPAGFLIDEVGLRGSQRGQAVISAKHANFIVNLGGAKVEDVLELIELARSKVFDRYGLQLEEEIRYIGFGE